MTAKPAYLRRKSKRVKITDDKPPTVTADVSRETSLQLPRPIGFNPRATVSYNPTFAR